MSHLTRGAWIEISYGLVKHCRTGSRTSHEVRGLKYPVAAGSVKLICVAPHTRCVD